MVALNRFLCYFTVVYVSYHRRYLDGSSKQFSVLFHWCVFIISWKILSSSKQVSVLFHCCVGAWKILRW